jgi:hypothetical protein
MTAGESCYWLESDSSVLTIEGGDESVAPTPKKSVNTSTDGGTDYGEGEDIEVAASPVHDFHGACFHFSY